MIMFEVRVDFLDQSIDNYLCISLPVKQFKQVRFCRIYPGSDSSFKTELEARDGCILQQWASRSAM